MKPKLRIGYLSTMYHTSLLIKRSPWLEAEGIEPSWSLFGTGPAIVDSLTKNDLDIGYIGLAPTIIGIGKGASVKCVAGGHVEGTVFIGRHDYQSVRESGDMGSVLAQFKGKRMGTPTKGSLHDVFLRYYLKQYGLSEDIQIVNYPWADFIPDALMKGEIDGAAGTPPLAVLSSRLNAARIVVPPEEIWPNNPSYGIVSSVDFREKNADVLEKFLSVHRTACQRIRENPHQAAKTISKTVRMVDDAFVLETLRVSPKYCAALSREFIDSTLRLVPVLQELGYLSAALSESQIFDHTLIDKIHPARPHYHCGSKSS